MSTMNQPEVLVTVTAAASTEVKKFMEQENVDPGKGGLRISVQPGGTIPERRHHRLCVVDAGLRIHLQEPELHGRLRLRQLFLRLTRASQV